MIQGLRLWAITAGGTQVGSLVRELTSHVLFGALGGGGGHRKEILIQATTWKNPENLMLSDLCQSLKDKNCMIPPL